MYPHGRHLYQACVFFGKICKPWWDTVETDPEGLKCATLTLDAISLPQSQYLNGKHVHIFFYRRYLWLVHCETYDINVCTWCRLWLNINLYMKFWFIILKESGSFNGRINSSGLLIINIFFRRVLLSIFCRSVCHSCYISKTFGL